MTSSVTTILLLDEDPILRRATALMLSNRGAAVSAVSTLTEALELTEARLFDVAILELAPEGSKAKEILGQIAARGLLPKRIVVCTTTPMTRDEEPSFAVVLQKPYPFEHLLTAVFGPTSKRRPTRSGIFPSLRIATATSRASSKRGGVPSREQTIAPAIRETVHSIGALRAVPGANKAGGAVSVVTVEGLGSRALSTEAHHALPTSLRGPRRSARARRKSG